MVLPSMQLLAALLVVLAFAGNSACLVTPLVIYLIPHMTALQYSIHNAARLDKRGDGGFMERDDWETPSNRDAKIQSDVSMLEFRHEAARLEERVGGLITSEQRGTDIEAGDGGPQTDATAIEYGLRRDSGLITESDAGPQTDATAIEYGLIA
jgi:hypothetical protein